MAYEFGQIKGKFSDIGAADGSVAKSVENKRFAQLVLNVNEPINAKASELFRGDRFDVHDDIFIKNDSNKVTTFFADVTTAKTMTVSNQIPKHPAEDGYPFNDEVIRDPFQVRVEGKIVGSVIGSELTFFDQLDREGKVELKWDAFRSVAENFSRITLTGKGGIVDGLRIKKLQRDDKNSESGFSFMALLEQVRVVSSKKVNIPREILIQEIKDSGESKKDEGKTSAEGVEDEEIEVVANQDIITSIVSGTYDFLGGADEKFEEQKQRSEEVRKDLENNFAGES